MYPLDAAEAETTPVEAGQRSTPGRRPGSGRAVHTDGSPTTAARPGRTRLLEILVGLPSLVLLLPVAVYQDWRDQRRR